MHFPQGKNDWIGIGIYVVILILLLLVIALLGSIIFGIYKLVDFVNSRKVSKFIDITIENYENKQKH